MTSATRTFVKTYHDILKIKKINNQIFTLQAKQVYCYLLSWQESNGAVFMQLKTMADDLGLGSINTAKKHITDLVSLGLLEVKSGRGGNSNTYFVKTVNHAESLMGNKSVLADNSKQVKPKPDWLLQSSKIGASCIVKSSPTHNNFVLDDNDDLPF